jgi:precorrin-2 dehydrogenase / sirohydrochlorin ferrochelatase
MEEKQYYMACLDLEGRRCLVVGGGRIALEKVTGLVTCGARVTVVAPEALPEVQALATEWREREYERADLEGQLFVIAATDIRALNEQVSRDAEERGMLCNVVDQPDLCSFILPAVHRSGPIAVAISTGGASPALAQRMRDEIAERYDERYVELARRLRDLRPAAKERFATYEERKAYFQQLVDEELGPK